MANPVGKTVLTKQGIYALADAFKGLITLAPRYFKASSKDYGDIYNGIDVQELEQVWYEDEINSAIPVDDNTVEFILDIPPDRATNYTRTFGLYLDNGVLFALSKTPYPYPPLMRHLHRAQLKRSAINKILDFKYIPFYETEQSLMTLQTAAVLGDEILSLSKTLTLLEGDYRQLKAKVNRLLSEHSERLSEQEKLTFELQLLLLQAISTLGDAINNLAKDISALKAQIFKEV